MLVVILLNQWLSRPIHADIGKSCPEMWSTQKVNFMLRNSAWNYTHVYSRYFQFQMFQLIIYSYVGHQRRQRNGYLTSGLTVLSVLVLTGGLSFLLNKAFEGVDECFNICNEHTKSMWFDYWSKNYRIILLLFFVISLLQSQFMFFISREFILSMYDEVVNRSVT